MGLTASVTGDVVQVAVGDTGVGIPADDRQRLFEEFQQVGGIGSKTEGTGLGLTLAKGCRAAWRHDLGGEHLGHGSTFTFTLPVVGAEAWQPCRLSRRTRSGPGRAVGPASIGPLVLVARGRSEGADLLRIYLSEAGYTVDVARDGAEGLEKIRRLAPAAVVLDICCQSSMAGPSSPR